MFALPIVDHKDIDVILNDFYSHLIPDDARFVPAPDPWVVAFGYFQWFYSVSHPYVTQDFIGAPPRPVHREILEEEYVRDGHAQVVLLTCWHTATLARDALGRGDFEDGSSDMATVQAILVETRNVL